ncbi:hypothetical protein QNI19_06075 [Cytophagaceae bacterium DM2B3-1]|uniref:Lipoprotein n=1 Tax=Xanthocytophaga flava TaxID=3048013 RepID=A0ABT7CII7_9BACT|nr:hypothetical protein [Xanthocytophaga flavus]MDJ1492489.1 hypothetical protein [Xanthocytophaga flavus]
MKRFYSISVSGILFLLFFSCQHKQDKSDSTESLSQLTTHKASVFPKDDFAYAIIYSVPFNDRQYFIDSHSLADECNAPSMISKEGKIIYDKLLNNKRLTEENLVYLDSLLKIPSRELKEDYACSPQYKDAIIYYNRDDKPIGWINVCFGCQHICFQPENATNRNLAYAIDYPTIDGIYSLFQQLGVIDKKIPQHEIDRIHREEKKKEINFLELETK